jgi:DNA-directed RNA polymerase
VTDFALQICAADLQRVAIGDFEEKLQVLPADDVSSPVRAVEQKGQGLNSLKQTLTALSGNFDVMLADNQDPDMIKSYRVLRQQRLEANAIQSAIDRWHHEMDTMRESGVDTSGGGKKLGHVLNQWHTDLVSKIHEELKLVAEAERLSAAGSRADRERRAYGVYLRCMDPEKLAAITILHVIHIFSRAGVEKGLKLASIVTTLGREIQDELIAQEVLRKSEQAEGRRQKMVAKMLETRKQRVGRGKWRTLVQQTKESDPSVAWPVMVEAQVGGVLMALLFEVAKTPVVTEHPETKKRVTVMQPAFQHSYEVLMGRRLGLIHMHPEVSGRLFREPPADMIARHMPMVAEPKPWTGYREGGFLAHRSQMMRCSPGDLTQELYIKKAVANGGLEHVRAGLDVLGKTAWVINQEVFDVMLEAWNSGEGIAKIPPLDPDFPFPPEPSEADPQARKEWSRKVRVIENRLAGFHSSRCFMNFQMEIARTYRNETFYLPHNVDFRGRAYPIPSYLNQMGADHARALLLFNEAKPLGTSGLRWLKIHLSNVFGFDKASLQEREDFTTQHLDDVLDSANNGLHGRRWFLQAEDPWQCLAACCELRNALRLPDPTQYASRLPIHQDGSCNGLQHYAALGGDVQGAQQVNLEPSDRPSDVYTGVAEFVKEKVAREAAQGNEIAKILDGKIKRKIVKQTVMTNVYGVTFIGAMRQVRRQLEEHYPGLDEANECTKYIARSIFEALGSIFSGAHSIQYWLGDCASRISTSVSPAQIKELVKDAMDGDNESHGGSSNKTALNDVTKMFRSTIIWTTPLGLPVVQPYRVIKTRRVQTSLQDLSIQDRSIDGVVSKRKQLQAFPPNFIHSLDATHMMLSAIECHRRGLTFSAVHDSFWTHACDVDVMNTVLRDSFVRMHSDDIIKRLASEFRVRYRDHLFLGKVRQDTPIGRAIAKHRRKGALKQMKELLEEHQRQTLLRSEDPELQERGRAMVTAASIFEAMGGKDSDLAVPTTLGETGIGAVPSDLDHAQRAALNASDVDNKDPAVSSLFADFDPQFNESGANSSKDGEAVEEDELKADEAPEKKPKKATKTVWLWLPLKFREVPTKGDFDVNRLKESQYFFS